MRPQAFKTFAKLWKFQQEHREPLTNAGLRRWEIGEIASKIGQLYYNFYLRWGGHGGLKSILTRRSNVRFQGLNLRSS